MIRLTTSVRLHYNDVIFPADHVSEAHNGGERAYSLLERNAPVCERPRIQWSGAGAGSTEPERSGKLGTQK